MKRVWKRLLETLVWVRVGQELGTDSELAQAIAGGIDVAVSLIGRLLSAA